MSSRVEEMVLALLSGETVTFAPHCRVEAYLMRCIEGSGTEGLPNPISRIEILLWQLVEKIAAGGFGSGTGGEVSDEDIATDEEVQEAIDEVFGADPGTTVPDEDIATDEEVLQTLSDVFDTEPEAITVNEEVFEY